MGNFESGYALIIGVGADQPSTLLDAQNVADILRAPLRCAYRKENVRLLLEHEATRSEVEGGLAWLAECTREDPTATAIVYYSGHGLIEPAACLALRGCFDTAGNLLPREVFETEGLPGTDFCEKLDWIAPRKLMVFLDCCYAAAQAESFRDIQREETYFDRLKEGEGRVVLAASAGHQRSIANDRQGYFTAALIEGLAGYGSTSNDGYARIFDIAWWIFDTVKEKSQGRQQPILRCNRVSQNFPVAFYAGGDPLGRDLSPGNPRPRIPANLNSEAERATFRKLEHLRKEILEREAASSSAELSTRQRREAGARIKALRDEVFIAEARLGLLPQQGPFYQQLSRWWGWSGVAVVFISLLGYWGTQSAGRVYLFGQTNRASISVFGLMLTGILLLFLFAFAELFQRGAEHGDWCFRLPVAFDWRALFFAPGFTRVFQSLTLFFFFVLPLVYQGHCFRKIHEEYLWAHSHNSDHKLSFHGMDHWIRYHSFSDSIFGDKYQLGMRQTAREGITYFPFWATWFFTICYAAWIAAFFRLVLRLAGIDNGKPCLIDWLGRLPRPPGIPKTRPSSDQR